MYDECRLLSCVLDPLSVIIKLAILSNKPVGTKVMIQNYVIHFQEPGYFQALCRYVMNSNKQDLQFLYNPIKLACQHYLSTEMMEKTPRIKTLFMRAQQGIEKLKETYKSSSLICLCLNYYNIIITNFLQETYSDSLFRSDSMTNMYSIELVKQLNSQWNSDKFTVVLDLITFLNNDDMAAVNVKSLENIMESVDKQTQATLDFSS